MNMALDLHAESHDEERLKLRVTEAVKGISDEVRSITGLDKASVKHVFDSLTADYKMWTCIAAMIGSATGTLPPVATAASAVTAFSLLGTAALKESRDRKEKLRKSKWSFVYYLRN